jgi:hypothetical protein
MSSIPDSLLSEYRARVIAAARGPLPPLDADEHYAALWRASSMEKVPYTEDFPEALLVLPELLDGSLGQGFAGRTGVISIIIKVYPDGVGILTVTDNGGGISNLSRFLKWAATKSVDNIHRNGHGMKKCMTKWARLFQMAVWAVVYRNKNRNAVHVKYPYKGSDTLVEDLENDDNTLRGSGTSVHIVFNSDVLGTFNTAEKLAAGIQEVIETRYREPIFERVDFELDIEWGESHVVVNSSDEEKPWHSFRYFVEQEVAAGNAVLEKHVEGTSNGAPWLLDRFKLTLDGKKAYALKTRFPHFGTKTPSAQRVHLALGERVIEAMPYHKLAGKPSAHPTENGTFVFVTFTGGFSALPEPATTKVSLYEQDPIFTQFKSDVRRILNSSAVDAPPAPPVPVQRGLFGNIADFLSPASVLAPAPVRDEAPPARKNVTKDMLCRLFDIDASHTGDSLMVSYKGVQYDMTVWKVEDIRFTMR